jgi:hypothetical protein
MGAGGQTRSIKSPGFGRAEMQSVCPVRATGSFGSVCRTEVPNMLLGSDTRLTVVVAGIVFSVDPIHLLGCWTL